MEERFDVLILDLAGQTLEWHQGITKDEARQLVDDFWTSANHSIRIDQV